MAISKVLKADKSNSVDIPVGTEIGLLLGVVHLGTQKNTYKGVTSFVDQVLLQFELQDVLTESGQPIIFSKIERNSMKAKANLLKFGKAIGIDVDEGIDFESLIGKPIGLTLDHNEAGTRVTIKGYTALSKRDLSAVKPLMGTPRLYLDVDTISESQKSELPEFVRKMINERITEATSTNSDNNDSIEL